MRFAIVFVCLAMASFGSAHAQENPTIITVLALAKDVAESGKTEQERISLRSSVARFMRNTDQAAAFGNYVIDALGAAETLERQNTAFVRQREEEARNQEIVDEAKRALFSGDLPKARQLARQWGERQFYHAVPDMLFDGWFLHWELEAQDLDGALRRLRTTDWTDEQRAAVMTESVARAFVAAGRRTEGLAVLSDPQTSPRPAPYRFAEAFWKFGDVEEGKRLQREAVSHALAAVEQNVAIELPIDLVGVQLAMGDRLGAIETLRRLGHLAAPLEYEFVDHASDQAPAAMQKAKMKPATRRWLRARFRLAETLTWAGLDADAFALLDEPVIDEADLLKSIVSGQAKRGDFAAAFETAERIRSDPLRVTTTRAEEPTAHQLEAVGPNSYQPRAWPVSWLLNDNKRAWFYFAAMASIARHAARRGDKETLRQACRLNRELNPALSSREACGPHVLRNLAKAGRIQAAVELALESPYPAYRLRALGSIAEGLAGILGPLDRDPLRP